MGCIVKWLIVSLLCGASPFEAWEQLPQRTVYATTNDAFSAWEQLSEREAAFAQWEELCRHKCSAECTCGDECECSADCDCLIKKKSAKPSTKLSTEAQKKLDESRAKPKADLSELKPSYPVRDSRTWWSHPGERTKPNIINHLMTGEHSGKYARATLEQMTLAELESLHSDDHEHRRKAIANIPKDAPENMRRMVPVYETRKVCNGGVCSMVRVVVGYRWE